MSAQVHTENGVFVGVAWFSGTATGEQGSCFDWGVRRERSFQMMEKADEGRHFVFDDGRWMTGDEFKVWVQARTWTFGEFGGTMAAFSEDQFTWSGF